MKIFGIFLALLVIALTGGVIYLGIADVSVPQTTVTKDVSAIPTPETPAKPE
ncbi:MAG: hypothetical protein KBC88_04190 [Alphaproteobacteria bacterium]|jgi:hypothetical protein|nr:hypothetical protein [Alphaproteobacteria bacterium]